MKVLISLFCHSNERIKDNWGNNTLHSLHHGESLEFHDSQALIGFQLQSVRSFRGTFARAGVTRLVFLQIVCVNLEDEEGEHQEDRSLPGVTNNVGIFPARR